MRWRNAGIAQPWVIVGDRLAGEIGVEVQIFTPCCGVAQVCAVRALQVNDQMFAIGQHMTADGRVNILRRDVNCGGLLLVAYFVSSSWRQCQFFHDDRLVRAACPERDDIVAGLQLQRDDICAGHVGGTVGSSGRCDRPMRRAGGRGCAGRTDDDLGRI